MDTYNAYNTYTHNTDIEIGIEEDRELLGPKAWAVLETYHARLESEDTLLHNSGSASKALDAIAPSIVYTDMIKAYSEGSEGSEGSEDSDDFISTSVAYAVVRRILVAVRCTIGWDMKNIKYIKYIKEAAERMVSAVEELMLVEHSEGHKFNVRMISATITKYEEEDTIQNSLLREPSITEFCSAKCVKCSSLVMLRNEITDALLSLHHMLGAHSLSGTQSVKTLIDASPYKWVHMVGGSMEDLKPITGCDDMKMGNALE